MDIERVILLIEKIMINQTGKVLSNTHVSIIRGLYENLSYWAIAEKYNYHNGYVGEKSRALFRVMEAELGYPVTKHNFRWVVDRLSYIKGKSSKIQEAPTKRIKTYEV